MPTAMQTAIQAAMQTAVQTVGQAVGHTAVSVALLDVNVLIALLDQRHVHLEAGQLTDTYLLALAVHHGGRLVSFDRRLSCEAVAGGREALWLLDG
jgi:hypothetical protein